MWRIRHFNDNHMSSSVYLSPKKPPEQSGKMHNVTLICYCDNVLLQKCTVKSHVLECATDSLHMMAPSNGNSFRVTGHCAVQVNSPHKDQWCGALLFSLIFAWMNSWVNNGDAGHLRHHRAHYDLIAMNKTDWATYPINIVINFIDKPYLH